MRELLMLIIKDCLVIPRTGGKGIHYKTRQKKILSIGCNFCVFRKTNN